MHLNYHSLLRKQENINETWMHIYKHLKCVQRNVAFIYKDFDSYSLKISESIVFLKDKSILKFKSDSIYLRMNCFQ